VCHVCKGKPYEARDGREGAGKKVNLPMAKSNIRIQISVSSDMKQFKSHGLRWRAAHLATQQAQTTLHRTLLQTEAASLHVGLRRRERAFLRALWRTESRQAQQSGKQKRAKAVGTSAKTPKSLSHRHLSKALPAPSVLRHKDMFLHPAL